MEGRKIGALRGKSYENRRRREEQEDEKERQNVTREKRGIWETWKRGHKNCKR